ncbi:patatin-like phospholipase family protein [Agromyces binzhouensis]|uniref:Uncharacterized protein n=1 Tax=Agromyces binzhouensis TaxID=1817495 RepID=A0A4Q2JF24_9MICO|nr:patatin-like phospholipase family protein [Agromyces binzhouensis]RXZ45254.1 hypothetical protein ESO86_13780 [Agromyces binzhouensis]
MAVVVEPAPTGTAVGLSDWVAAHRARAAHVLTAAIVVLGALIALSEIDRLIAGVLTSDGRSSPLGSVIGPLALTGSDAWTDWASTAISASIGGWVAASVLIDGVFIGAYAWIVVHVLRRMGLARPRRLAGTTLLVLLVVEALEGAALLVGAAALVGWPFGPAASAALLTGGPQLAWVVAALATAKWITVILLAVFVFRDASARRTIGVWIRRLAQAVWLHRLSAVLVVALFVLTCIPTDGVLDQLPDLQRQWVPLDADSTRHVAVALASVGIAVACAYVLGRARTRALASAVMGFDVRTVPSKRSHALWWCAPIAVWLLLWLATGSAGGSWLPGWSAVAFLVVPAVVIASYLLRPDAAWPVRRRPDRLDRARWAWLTGDAIAVSIASIAGLGLVRSFTAPVFAGWDLPLLDAWAYPMSVVLLVAGAAMAVLAPLLLRGNPTVARLLDPQVRVDEDAPDRGLRLRHRRLVLGFFLAGLLVLAITGVWPVQFAAFAGAPALAVLLLTTWGAVLGSFTVAVQEHPPAPVFRFLRLRADPVLTLAIVVPLVWAIVAAAIHADDPALHATRTGSPAAASETGTDGDAFETQVDARIRALAAGGCTATVGGTTFTPALLVVAEGGGIRAAYWTARALEELGADGECLGRSVLVSSGVSGGSVGLAVTAIDRQGSEELVQLAGPDAVSTGTAALIVGDLVASTTGLRFPSVLDGSAEWRDRASLIEHVWVGDVAGLRRQVVLGASPRIGIPVLNSTDVRSKCKVLVSNGVATDPSVSAGATSAGCDTAATAPAASLPVSAACFAGMEWATAAMLSARFPVITPAARIEPGGACGEDGMQLVDGGYAEGSGLGTAADLAPVLADRISVWNEGDGAGGPPVVPILVYLKNSGGYDLRQDLEGVAAEPLVPLVGAAALSKSGTEQVLRQRISAAFRTIGEPDDPSGDAIAAARGVLPGLTVVVAPSTEPAVVPPLGWALSGFSIGSLERGIERQLREPDPDAGDGAPPTLRTLLDLTG